MASTESLNVIALISGGKDSFYTILHCLYHGHRIVALANLYPPDAPTPTPADTPTALGALKDEPADGPQDLNSFMYQTAGHQVIPLYAAATGIPLYRGLIAGKALQSGITYAAAIAAPLASGERSHLQSRASLHLPAGAQGGAALPKVMAESAGSHNPGRPHCPCQRQCDCEQHQADSKEEQDGDAEMMMGVDGPRLGTWCNPGCPLASSLLFPSADATNSVRHTTVACSSSTNRHRPDIASPMEHAGDGDGGGDTIMAVASSPSADPATRRVIAIPGKGHHRPPLSQESCQAPGCTCSALGTSTRNATAARYTCSTNDKILGMTEDGDGGRRQCELAARRRQLPSRNWDHHHQPGLQPATATCFCTTSAVKDGITENVQEVNQTQSQDDSITITAVAAATPKQDTVPVPLKGKDEDETESMTNLLRTILVDHPEANALCAGAILSTYQRVRVESVATRLGLTPLAFLWKFPILPPPPPPTTTDVTNITTTIPKLVADATQLLRDMYATGLSARIVKVASAGLDEGFLWEEATCPLGINRLSRALARFGGAGSGGAVIGEGGEFETLVVDGPRRLFRGRIEVDNRSMVVVREGGGCSWLGFERGGGKVVMKTGDEEQQNATSQDALGHIREPPVLDEMFRRIQCELLNDEAQGTGHIYQTPSLIPSVRAWRTPPFLLGTSLASVGGVEHWVGMGGDCGQASPSVEETTRQIMSRFQDRLLAANIPPAAVVSSLVVLRRMSDFTIFNSVYGSSFVDPLPPARVCVACSNSDSDSDNDIGSDDDAMPRRRVAILIHLTVLTGDTGREILATGRRRGLHVQSRSYWAPANIGPYSQAIEVPLVPGLSTIVSATDSISRPGKAMAVAIAGQIPLVPATMALLRPSTGSSLGDLTCSSVLSLQHLWRIAVDVRVQWFACAMVYVPKRNRNGDGGDQDEEVSRHFKQTARLVDKLWKSAHLWNVSDKAGDSEDEDEDDDGPDLWDRKFNPAYQTFGAERDDQEDHAVPAWEIFSSEEYVQGNDDGGAEGCSAEMRANGKTTREALVSSVFIAEVDTLPRSAPVEWHVPLSLRDLEPGTTWVLPSHTGKTDAGWTWTAEHIVLDLSGTKDRFFVHSTVWLSHLEEAQQDTDEDEAEGNSGEIPWSSIFDLLADINTCWRKSLSGVVSEPTTTGRRTDSGSDSRNKGMAVAPYLVYIDEASLRLMGKMNWRGEEDKRLDYPVVPCRSLYTGKAEKMASLAYFKSLLLK